MTYNIDTVELHSNASVQKRVGPASAPGREWALRAKAGIALDRPFWFFCGYDKRTGLSGQEETKVVHQHKANFKNALTTRPGSSPSFKKKVQDH